MYPKDAQPGDFVQNESGQWAVVRPRGFMFGITVQTIVGAVSNGMATGKATVWMTDDIVAHIRKKKQIAPRKALSTSGVLKRHEAA